jgi:hypothetical protein
MKPRRTAVLVLTGVALAAAGGGAVAATQSDPEKSIIEDAAKRLDVTPKALRDALADAQRAELDKAVEAGRLTREEADRIKQRRLDEGHVLGGLRVGERFGGHGHGHGGPGRGRFDHGGPGAAIDAAAKALGLTRTQLFDRLRGGRSLADIARAEKHDLAGVKAAVRTALEADLDQAVKDGRLEQARAEDVLERFDERFDEFATRARPRPGHGGFGRDHRRP